MKESRIKDRLKRIFIIKSGQFYGILSVLWVILLILSILSFSKPLSVEKQGVKNNIVQKTVFDYKADLSPSSLYPNGGIIEPDGPIFTNITRSINIFIDTRVISDKPVIVKGTRKITCKLIAENLWEYDYFLRDKGEFSLEGTENSLIGEQLNIPIEQVLNFYNKVQEEIGAYSDGCTVKIIPGLTGIIKDGDREIPIDIEPEITFRLSNQVIEAIGEREFITETPIYENMVTHSTINVMGRTIALKYIRNIPIALLLLLTVYLGVGYYYRSRDQHITEAELGGIIKKYDKRLTNLKSNLDFDGRMILDLESFGDVIKIADDRDLPILSYRNNDENAIFYVIDNATIYSYKPGETAADHTNTAVVGSDLYYVR